MEHLINWIEIPVLDMARATQFYEAILEVHLHPMELGDLRYALFPAHNVYNTGALVQGEGYAPSSQGIVVYLDGRKDMDGLLSRVTAAGGRVSMPKTYLGPDAGHVAFFEDCEGNRIGVQAPETSATRVEDEVMQRLLGGSSPGVTVLLRKGARYDDPSTQPLQWEHARHMFTLLRSGALRHVTALLDGTDVVGVATLATGDAETARALFAQDPGVTGGRLTYEVLSSVHFAQETTRV